MLWIVYIRNPNPQLKIGFKTSVLNLSCRNKYWSQFFNQLVIGWFNRLGPGRCGAGCSRLYILKCKIGNVRVKEHNHTTFFPSPLFPAHSTLRNLNPLGLFAKQGKDHL